MAKPHYIQPPVDQQQRRDQASRPRRPRQQQQKQPHPKDGMQKPRGKENGKATTFAAKPTFMPRPDPPARADTAPFLRPTRAADSSSGDSADELLEREDQLSFDTVKHSAPVRIPKQRMNQECW